MQLTSTQHIREVGYMSKKLKIECWRDHEGQLVVKAPLLCPGGEEFVRSRIEDLLPRGEVAQLWEDIRAALPIGESVENISVEFFANPQ